MTTFSSLMMLFLFSTKLLDHDYNQIEIMKKRFIIRGYSEEKDQPISKQSYKIRRVNGNRYINFKSDSVFLDFDVAPKFQDSLSDYFFDNIPKNPRDISSRHHYFELCFLVSKDGKILERGISKGDGNKVYRSQVAKVLNEYDGIVAPGRLKNQSVSVVYFFEVDLSR